MKYISVLFIGLALLTSCGTPQESGKESELVVEETKTEPTTQELEAKSQQLIAKILDVKELGLQLNNGEKWEIENQILTDLLKVKQQIYVISGNMENYEVSSYNEMGKEFLTFVENIPVSQNEDANIQLNKVISESKKQCMHMLGADKQTSQIAVINLSNIYDEVPNYFVATQK